MSNFKAVPRLDESVGASIWFAYQGDNYLGTISRVVYPGARFKAFDEAGTTCLGETETLEEALDLYKET